MDDIEKLVCRFCDAQHEISMAYEEFAKQTGYSYTSIQIMHLIYNNPGCTQKMLNERTLFPKQTINAVITNLYNNGVVELREDPEDRRTKDIYYSTEGEKTAEGIFDRAQEIVRRSMAGLRMEELSALIETMEKFSNLMKDEIQDL